MIPKPPDPRQTVAELHQLLIEPVLNLSYTSLCESNFRDSLIIL